MAGALDEPGRSSDAPAGGWPAGARWLEALLNPIDKVVAWTVMAAMAVMTVVLVAQVALRYGLNTSLDWGWEVPRLCFIWSIFLSIPLGIRRSAHVGIDVVVALLPEMAKGILFRVNLVLMASLMVIVAYYAVVLASRTWDQLLPTLSLSVAVFYIALVWCGLHSVLQFLRLFCGGSADEWTASE